MWLSVWGDVLKIFAILRSRWHDIKVYVTHIQMTDWSSSGSSSFSHINWWLRYHTLGPINKSLCQPECIPSNSTNIAAAGQTQAASRARWNCSWFAQEMGTEKLENEGYDLSFGKVLARSYSNLVAIGRLPVKKLAHDRNFLPQCACWADHPRGTQMLSKGTY